MFLSPLSIGVPVKPMNINQLSFVLADAKHLINENVRTVVLLHVGHALVNVALQLGGITIGQCSDFVFHGFDNARINSGVNCPHQPKMLLRDLLETSRFWRSRVFILAVCEGLKDGINLSERIHFRFLRSMDVCRFQSRQINVCF